MVGSRVVVERIVDFGELMAIEVVITERSRKIGRHGGVDISGQSVTKAQFQGVHLGHVFHERLIMHVPARAH